jgi:2-phosphosulfolactate phosphatase
VRFEWGLAGARVLASVSEVLVVVDVLSFSTAVEVALARGATVVPTGSRRSAALLRDG